MMMMMTHVMILRLPDVSMTWVQKAKGQRWRWHPWLSTPSEWVSDWSCSETMALYRMFDSVWWRGTRGRTAVCQ